MVTADLCTEAPARSGHAAEVTIGMVRNTDGSPGKWARNSRGFLARC